MNKIQQLDGVLLAARYAFMPNKLRYCGGDTNSEIFNYITEEVSDPGLKAMLEEFATMYPYLKLIAESNKIFDPFNYQVVEAYWIGNKLLNNVSMKGLYRHMIDEQKLKKRFKPKLLEKVFGKIPSGAKPHHSWHVFNIPKRTGYYPVEHTLATMDACRIAPAQVKSLKFKVKSNFPKKVLVEYKPLTVENDKIILGKKIKKQVWSEVNDKAFVKELKVGDWISLHWDWLCDTLTEKQVKNLEKWTNYNLKLINL